MVKPLYTFFTLLTLAFTIQACVGPQEPHPQERSRFYLYPNTSLSIIVDNFYGLNCSGYFEITRSIDSATIAYNNTAMFCNALGDPYTPSFPSDITVNGVPFRDSITTDVLLQNYDAFPIVDNSYRWRINLSGDLLLSTIAAPPELTITYPPHQEKIVLPKKPFTLRYQLNGADSVYIELLTIYSDSIDESHDYFDRYVVKQPNTGSYEFDEQFVKDLLPGTYLYITVAAVITNTQTLNDNTYIFRSGSLDNTAIKFTE